MEDDDFKIEDDFEKITVRITDFPEFIRSANNVAEHLDCSDLERHCACLVSQTASKLMMNEVLSADGGDLKVDELAYCIGCHVLRAVSLASRRQKREDESNGAGLE